MPRTSRGPLPARRAQERVSTQTLKIEQLTPEGRGLARYRGQPVFVPGALPGEEVRVALHQRGKRLEAERVERLCDSAERVVPPCPLYGRCGGCDLQHLDSTRQLGYKQQWVLDLMQRLGQFQPEEVAEPLASPAWGYRQRARMAVRWQGSQLFFGFRQKNSQRIEPVSQCPVLLPELSELLTPLFHLLRGLGPKAGISHLELMRLGERTAVLLRTLKPLKEHATASLQRFAEQHALSLWLQPEEDRCSRQCFWSNGQDELLYLLDSEIELAAQPGDFIQVNGAVNRAMVRQALAWLAPKPGDRVLDLFCGIGNFSLPLAREASAVVAVEGVAESLQRGEANARRNGIDSISWCQADLEQPLAAHSWAKGGFNRILLDPPRTGARSLCAELGELGADSVLYVSCNPATLARDGAELVRQGYRCQRLGVMEMFPQTSHVETMALFVRS